MDGWMDGIRFYKLFNAVYFDFLKLIFMKGVKSTIYSVIQTPKL